MSMPWTCDALLPEAERYASLKFRRIARRFDATHLDYADACELAAFLGIVPVDRARWIFQWHAAGRREALRIVEHHKDNPDVLRMVEENLVGQTVDDGLAVFKAMQDGGWTYGKVPPIVRMAMLGLRDAGLSHAKVGEMCGITREQVRTITTGSRSVQQEPVFWQVTG